MNCLYCGNPLSETDTGWHRRCSRSFFGTDEVPRIDVTNETLASLATISIQNGNAIAGVQRKLSVHLSDEGGEHRLTLVGYPAGYILKPQTRDYPQLPEIEQLTMTLAETVGIKTVPHGLVVLADGTRAYITRRIDRNTAGSKRIPMEDTCQLSQRLTEDKYKGSYEQVARAIARYSSRPGIDLTELFLVLLFSFLTGNADMHLKNFSLFAPEKSWILCPAYDLVATSLVLPEDEDEMALALNGKRRKLQRSDFLTYADTAGIHEKAATGLISIVIGAVEKMSPLIRRSEVDRSGQERLLEIIQERRERLR